MPGIVEGLTVRDWFAGQMAATICQDAGYRSYFDIQRRHAAIARDAYSIADELVKRRSENEPPQTIMLDLGRRSRPAENYPRFDFDLFAQSEFQIGQGADIEPGGNAIPTDRMDGMSC